LLLYIENNCIIMIYIIKYTKNLLFFDAGWYCLLGQTLSQTQTSGSGVFFQSASFHPEHGRRFSDFRFVCSDEEMENGIQ
jgi:hypothetical protein